MCGNKKMPLPRPVGTKIKSWECHERQRDTPP